MGQTQSLPPPPAAPVLPVGHPPVASSSSINPPASCPMHQTSATADSAPLNPLNNMPNLSQSPSPHQSSSLPLDRTISSIPRSPSPDGSEVPPKWEYPSPQQFYNALVRKGWETPEEHVETMVDIHNFLNEEAWKEVMKWENVNDPAAPNPQLARFTGKPGQLSPKARIYTALGAILPSRFSSSPPFDRHDWIVRRATGEEVRYVIDYYSLPDDSEGNPNFSLDVRPALDSVGSVKNRIMVATQEAWGNFIEQQPSTGAGSPSRS